MQSSSEVRFRLQRRSSSGMSWEIRVMKGIRGAKIVSLVDLPNLNLADDRSSHLQERRAGRSGYQQSSRLLIEGVVLLKELDGSGNPVQLKGS